MLVLPSSFWVAVSFLWGFFVVFCCGLWFSLPGAADTAAFTADTKHKGKGKGPSKKPTGQGKKVRCLFLMPIIATMALHLLLVPTTHTEGPVLLLPMTRRVRRRHISSPRHRHGSKRGPISRSYRMWRPCLFLLYIACFFRTPTALNTEVPCRYYRAPVSIATVTSPHNTRYNNN